jgi:acetylornithine deacetylase/succinyl-diaminopimelate desuccinylase-like protein
MTRAVYVVLTLVLLHAPVGAQFDVAAPAPAGFDRAAAQRDTLEHLRRLIALDTQNPPGNEVIAAKYLDSVLRGIPGVEAHVLDPGDGRANFVARLRATKPARRAVLVMGHMDVVGVEKDKWSTPPFEATVRDGYVYGRGAIDDKGMLAASVAAMRQLAGMRDRLDRDVILLGTAAEEGGDQGIERVIAEHFDLVKDAEFALNEGGRVRVRDGRIYTINVQTTEKLSYVVDVTATGTSGHGSVPLPDNAIAALGRALARVQEAKGAIRLNAITREYFEGLGKVEQDPRMRDAMLALAAARDQPSVEKAGAVLSEDPRYNAVLRTGVSITMIDGGIRANVIPSGATAVLNVRVLPEGDIEADVAALNRIGAEPQVTFRLRGKPQAAPPVSTTATPLYEALETAAEAMVPGVVVTPFMSTGATDGAALRAKGIPTYGILPLPLTADDELRMHGDNERAPVQGLGWAAEYLYRVLLGVSGH